MGLFASISHPNIAARNDCVAAESFAITSKCTTGRPIALLSAPPAGAAHGRTIPNAARAPAQGSAREPRACEREARKPQARVRSGAVGARQAPGRVEAVLTGVEDEDVVTVGVGHDRLAPQVGLVDGRTRETEAAPLEL